jgi:nitrite reductase/ring-hydroxylating ferredoxin subunit
LNIDKLSNYWYPIIKSDDLKRKPKGVMLLSARVVLYRKEGEVIALKDECAHRSAALSKGRILTNGCIECPYHGWQFSTNGQCVKIPSNIKDNIPNRAKVDAFKAIDALGWIWLSLTPKHTLQNDPMFRQLSQMKRDSAVDFDLGVSPILLVENVLDPAHVPFAHDGSLSKRSRVQDIDFDVFDNEIASGEVVGVENQSKYTNRFDFLPGGGVLIRLYNKSDKATVKKYLFNMLHIIVPISAKESKVISFFDFDMLPKIIAKSSLLKLHNKIKSKKVIMEDYDILIEQSKRIEEGANAWNCVVPADKLGYRYRKWVTEGCY